MTEILIRIERGDRSAVDELLPQVYEQLRGLARERMSHERPDHTLQATALVNEAYIRLVQGRSSLQWESRGQFYVAAAEAMRRILIEHARKRLSQKRGGERQRAGVDPDEIGELQPERLLEFDEVLEQLAELDPRKAELVKLRCFAGLDREALSHALGISLATVDRDWLFAKAWLFRELSKADGDA